jgi:hypothetical protein
MDLIDTNLVSELRKVRSGKAQQPVPLGDHLHELELGVLLAERRDPTQGALLRHWLQQAVVPAFAGRLLVVVTRNLADFEVTGVPLLNP